jgi:uncharacterized alkaline shock family protein YloU
MTQAGFGTAPAPEEPKTPSFGEFADKASAFADTFGDRAGEYAEKVGDRAGEYAEKVGDAVQQAAGATGRFAEQVVHRLRNNAEIIEDRGTTTIANEVVEKVAAIATREVDGVFDLGGDVARLFTAVREKLGLGDRSESADQGVSVRLEGTKAAVNITFVIEYGFVVYTVAARVRANVISAVEKMLGLEVTEVNLLVDDVHLSEQPAAAAPGAAIPATAASPAIAGGPASASPGNPG